MCYNCGDSRCVDGGICTMVGSTFTSLGSVPSRSFYDATKSNFGYEERVATSGGNIPGYENMVSRGNPNHGPSQESKSVRYTTGYPAQFYGSPDAPYASSQTPLSAYSEHQRSTHGAAFQTSMNNGNAPLYSETTPSHVQSNLVTSPYQTSLQPDYSSTVFSSNESRLNMGTNQEYSNLTRDSTGVSAYGRNIKFSLPGDYSRQGDNVPPDPVRGGLNSTYGGPYQSMTSTPNPYSGPASIPSAHMHRQSSTGYQSQATYPNEAFAAMTISPMSPGITTTTYGDLQETTYQFPVPTTPAVPIAQYAPMVYPSKCLHPDCINKKQKVFDRSKDWEDHNKRAHAKQHHCGLPDCRTSLGMMFGTQAELRRHIRDYHRTGRDTAIHYDCTVFGCQGRAKSFLRHDKFKEHNAKWHGRYICTSPGCVRGAGHGFVNQVALDRHWLQEHA